MSIEIMNAVWRTSRASGRQKLVLLAIADHQGEQGAWPSIATLARMVNASERSVQRDIQELSKMGELLIEPQSAPGLGQYKANRYWVTLSGVTDSTSGVTNSAVRGDRVVVQTLNRNLIEPIHRQDELDGAFLEFWQLYPRKQYKTAVYKCFIKVCTRAKDPVDPQTLIEGARRLANDPNLPPKEFIPNGEKWLNQGGWENEPYPEREKTAEEKQALAKAKAEADRQAALAENARMRAESEKARAEATPAPQCVHGKNLVLCRVCIKNVGSQE